jgi:hypothetical protein
MLELAFIPSGFDTLDLISLSSGSVLNSIQTFSSEFRAKFFVLFFLYIIMYI